MTHVADWLEEICEAWFSPLSLYPHIQSLHIYSVRTMDFFSAHKERTASRMTVTIITKSPDSFRLNAVHFCKIARITYIYLYLNRWMKYVRHISVTISVSFPTVKCLTGARLMTLPHCTSESIRTVCFISTSHVCACATLHFIANFTTVPDLHHFVSQHFHNWPKLFPLIFFFTTWDKWGCLWAIFCSPESDIQPVFPILDSLCSLWAARWRGD